jgi:hypothetical protein
MNAREEGPAAGAVALFQPRAEMRLVPRFSGYPLVAPPGMISSAQVRMVPGPESLHLTNGKPPGTLRRMAHPAQQSGQFRRA